MEALNNSKLGQGGRWVICRSIRRNGRIIYPKNGKVFRFWVKDKAVRARALGFWLFSKIVANQNKIPILVHEEH